MLLANSGGNATAGFNVTTGLSSVVNAENNLLKGTLVPLHIDLTESSPNYSFGRYRESADVPYVAGFYKYNSSNYEMKANRAWLEWSGGSSSRGLVLSFDGDETTALTPVISEKKEVNSDIYDLQGRKVAQPTKGLYIANGKKVVIK